MRIVFTELLENRELVEDGLQDDDVSIYDHPLRKEELIQAADDAEILSVFIYTDVPREVIDSIPGLKLIVTRSVGFDHIDAKYALERGIEVCHVPDYGAHVVAEHAFALLLAVAKNVVRADTYVKSGRRFDFEPFLGTELRDKTIGVVGTGKIGAESIRIAKGSGMNVVAYDIYQNIPLSKEYDFPYLTIEELLEQSDYVTLHAPLTPETHHMINAESLSRMKRGAILVNAARGGLVDTAALKEALESGQLGGAGMDVLEDEKHPSSDLLLSAPNLVITPHSAFFTREALKRITLTSLGIINSFKEGEVKNRIPKEYL
jgi:D-lactate dehydrogenase